MSKDLIILVADADIEFGLRGILERPQAVGMRAISDIDFRRHPERDPGCHSRGHDYLRPFVNQYAHALVVHDLHGCGREHDSRTDVEQDLEERVRDAGWGDRAAVVVVAPEIEAWVWSDTVHVDRVLGWEGRDPDLRTWLQREGLITARNAKPADPRLAMESALAAAGKPRRSSSYFRELGRNVGLSRCVDPAFLKLRQTLRAWFPPGQGPSASPGRGSL